MFNLDGDLVNVDVRPSTYPLKGISKSKLQTYVGQYLQDKYPREAILEEFYIPNSKLSIDFFIPQMKLCIECDGIQHTQHSSYFHGNRNISTKYAKQKIRDTNKEYWCELNGFKLIRIEKQEDIECL